MKKSGKWIKEICVTGFALFATFFGAGNLIFPPALGLQSGKSWFWAFLGFFVMDAGLAILGVIVAANQSGDRAGFAKKLGPEIGTLIMTVMALCVGPLVVIPRTGAVTYSMAVRPLLGLYEDNPLVLLVFSILFFAVVLLLTIKPGKVVDIVGSYMTPILLILLLLISILGIILATNGAGETLVEDPIKEGVANGYQTMDGMGAVLVAGIIVSSLKGKYDEKGCRSVINKSSILAAILLFIVYGGLTYLGVVWGQPMAEAFMSGKIDQAGLLTGIVYQILGRFGVYAIAIVTLLACLTTAIGLASAVANYFENLTRHKVSYKTFAIIICICGAVLCNVGLSSILKIAQPILTAIYPVIIVLLVMSLCDRWIPGRLPTIIGAAVAFTTGIITVLCDTVKITAFSFIHAIPLDRLGLNFVIPSICGIIIGIIIDRLVIKRQHSLQ